MLEISNERIGMKDDLVGSELNPRILIYADASSVIAVPNANVSRFFRY
jgi:hypothetical protein